MTQNNTINQHINEFLEYYMNLSEPQYAVLLSGKWGSGKTHFIEKFKKNHTDIHIVKISLFGLKFKEDIHKKIVLEQFTFPKTSEAIAKNMHNVLEKFTGINLNLTLSDISVGLAIKQMWNKTTLFVFDDLERMEMSFLEAFGYINQLVEEYGQKVIFIADESKLIDREEYQQFKEKIIGKTFEIEQNFEAAFETFTDELKSAKEILNTNKSSIKSVFDRAGYNNLRSLRQGILDFDRLIEQFEEKFKKHSELMTEFIQIFFALVFEIRSGKLDIQTLKDMSMLRIGKMLNDNKPNEELTLIEKIFQKYSFFSYELLLSHENWINFFILGKLEANAIAFDLNRSRYFLQEQQEEWVKLWHYVYLEDEEFQITLNETLQKLKDNEYLEPVVFMHVVGIVLALNKSDLYDVAKENIISEMKQYIDNNTKQWIDLNTVDHHRLSWNHFGLGYQSEESEEFRIINDYLVQKAEDVRNEGLNEKGDLLVQYLNENKIQEFTDILSAEKNKEILYRLPVFTTIRPEDFFDSLMKVKNKDISSVRAVLHERYKNILGYEKEAILEELNFWKSFIKFIDKYPVNIPITIKDMWFKKRLRHTIEQDIIQKIEKEIERKNRIKQLEVTENEQFNN